LSHGASACFTSNTGCEYSLTGISSCNGNTICLYFNFTFSSPNYVSSLYIGCYGGFYVAYVTFEKSHGTSPPDCMTLSGLTGFTNLGPATHVCNDGGDLAIGDLIVTSSTAGVGMKQSDDIVHSYTVARCREAVTFSGPGDIQTVACIYHCG